MQATGGRGIKSQTKTNSGKKQTPNKHYLQTKTNSGKTQTVVTNQLSAYVSEAT